MMHFGSSPRVLGLDLAAESSGVARTDHTTLTIRAPKAAGKRRALADDLARLDHIEETVAALLAEDRPHLAVIEDYAPGIRSAAAHRLAEVAGTVRLACWRAAVPLALVNAMHLKQYATGRTRAEKGDMRIAALKRAGVEFANDDECDAWWLRAMGLDYLGCPVVAMPSAHRAVLERITWPTTALGGAA